jgi:hypothetical protein
MRIPLVICLALAGSLVARRAAAQEVDCTPESCPSPEKLTDAALAAIADGAHCGQADARAPLCEAVAGWAKGTAPALPVGKVLVGVKSLEIGGRADDVRDPQRLDIQLFAVRSIRGKDTLARVWRPIDEWADDAMTRILRAVDGKATTAWAVASTHADLALYLAEADHEPTVEDGAWAWDDCEQGVRYQLRKVGARWIALGIADGSSDWFSLTVFAPR